LKLEKGRGLQKDEFKTKDYDDYDAESESRSLKISISTNIKATMKRLIIKQIVITVTMMMIAKHHLP
jgi:hypothetical protein